VSQADLFFKTHHSFLGAFAELQKATVSFIMSACPYGTARLLLDRFP